MCDFLFKDTQHVIWLKNHVGPLTRWVMCLLSYSPRDIPFLLQLSIYFVQAALLKGRGPLQLVHVQLHVYV